MQRNNVRASVTPDDIKEQLSDPALIRLKIELQSARQRLRQQQALETYVQQLKRRSDELQKDNDLLRAAIKQADCERSAAEEKLAEYKNVVRLAGAIPQKQADAVSAELITIATGRDADFSTDFASQMQSAASSQKSGVSGTLDRIYQQLAILRQQDAAILERTRAAQRLPCAKNASNSKAQPQQELDAAFQPQIRLLQGCVEQFAKAQRKTPPDSQGPQPQNCLLSALVSQVAAMFRALLSEAKSASSLRQKLALGQQTQEALNQQIDALRDVLDQQAEQIERLCAIPGGKHADN